MRSIETTLSLLILATLASCFLAQLKVSGQGQMLTGEGHWDMSMVQEYCKKLYHIDVPAAPAPYPETDTEKNAHRSLLGTLNPEFRKRVDAVAAIYQAFCQFYTQHNVIGIIPGVGALRDSKNQRDIYAIGRHKVPPTASGTHKSDWKPEKGPGTKTQAWVSWHQLGMAVDF